MCIVAIAWQLTSEQPLLLLNNRDEFTHRDTLPLHQWSDEPIVGGRDQTHGGTWLGVTPEGRWAVVTNVREPLPEEPLVSRGQLVVDYLRSSQCPLAFARSIELRRYAGFNLIVGTRAQAVAVSNRGLAPTVLPAGVYVQSNGLLDEPWPKVERLRRRVTQEVLSLVGDEQRHAAFRVMHDSQTAPDHHLPDTGVELSIERALSSIYIDTPLYGTQSTSLLRFDSVGWRMEEQNKQGLIAAAAPWADTECV